MTDRLANLLCSQDDEQALVKAIAKFFVQAKILYQFLQRIKISNSSADESISAQCH